MTNIRLATMEDVDEIMSFIDDEWKKGHILSRDRSFFLYEHQKGDVINFVVSKDSENKINGLLGFIKASAGDDSDIWTVIWKVSKNDTPALGIKLLEFLRNSTYRSVMSPGINKKTIGIYAYLGLFTGVLRHYVILNNHINEYKIASIGTGFKSSDFLFKKNNSYKLERIDSKFLKANFDFTRFKDQIPYKDEHYFAKRYFQHPIYKYDVYGIFTDGRLDSLIVTRVVSVDDNSVLRIVDFIGDEKNFFYITHFLYEIVVERNFEYVDFLSYGFNDEILKESGFREVDLDSDELIIPEYFSPFVRKNIKINFFIDSPEGMRFRFCKADGDQDRPN